MASPQTVTTNDLAFGGCRLSSRPIQRAMRASAVTTGGPRCSELIAANVIQKLRKSCEECIVFISAPPARGGRQEDDGMYAQMVDTGAKKLRTLEEMGPEE